MHLDLPGHLHALVGIELKHSTAFLQILLRPFHRGGFHGDLADRVGTAEALPLDDFAVTFPKRFRVDSTISGVIIASFLTSGETATAVPRNAT